MGIVALFYSTWRVKTSWGQKCYLQKYGSSQLLITFGLFCQHRCVSRINQISWIYFRKKTRGEIPRLPSEGSHDSHVASLPISHASCFPNYDLLHPPRYFSHVFFDIVDPLLEKFIILSTHSFSKKQDQFVTWEGTPYNCIYDGRDGLLSTYLADAFGDTWIIPCLDGM